MIDRRPITTAPNARKALLICALAEALSTQCTKTLRRGSDDGLLDLQARKHTIIEELAGLLRGLDVAALPELHLAVERLRTALRAETGALTEASVGLQNELISVNAAQRRLTHARQYDTAAMSPSPRGGGQLSASG
jgi:hypothetical protein